MTDATQMNKPEKRFVSWPLKKDYSSPEVICHWAHLEKPDSGNPDFNIRPNHQVVIRVSEENRKKLETLAIEAGASKGISGLRPRLDEAGKETGEWLLTCKTTQHVGNSVRFPEIYDTNGQLTKVAVSRGDKIKVLCSPGLLTAQKKLTFFLKKVTFIESAQRDTEQTSTSVTNVLPI